MYPEAIKPVAESVARTGRLVIVEEGISAMGIGSEWVARIAEQTDSIFKVRRVGALPMPIPGARNLEREVLPSEERILYAFLEVLD